MMIRPKTNRERRIWARRAERGARRFVKKSRLAWAFFDCGPTRSKMKTRLYYSTVIQMAKVELFVWNRKTPGTCLYDRNKRA